MISLPIDATQPQGLVMLLLASGAVSLSAADFGICLHRPESVGDRTVVHATGLSFQLVRILVDGVQQPNRDEKIAVDFEVAAEVQGVTPAGKPTKIKLVIRKAQAGPETPSEALLPADAVVVVERVNGKTAFVDDKGAAYPKPVHQALSIVFSIGDGSTNDDQVFGTNEKKKPGDTWPVAADFAVQKLRDEGLPVDLANVKGTVSFLGLVKDGGVECQNLSASMQMKDVAFPLPRGLKTTSSNLEIVFAGHFPVDITKPRTQQSMSMDTQVEAAGKVPGHDGTEKAVSFTMTMKRRAELFITPAAK